MRSEKYLIEQKNYFAEDRFFGIDTEIRYTKEFRLRWAATQLNLFVSIGTTEALIDKKMMEQFSNETFSYAIVNSKGWPRGFQSTIASIAILKGNHVDITAIGYCEQTSKKHFAAFEIPIVYDLENKKGTRFKSSPVWGGLYYPHFSKIIDELFKEFNNQ
ncbi:hypothetical protein [Ulvibacter antarcticus]|uniref:Uncharacterized protein n=1 Tax=Ulvibacter antarcticus TaxID=442714 RepID=A0A3L9YLF1_9FLAO|nr:hypothetical protein [Ulvibacter antarcticus]RMA58975.1 hypothetical protein BXY75_2357 [Ulvibacter antarcticus]